jgi:hypothetical protein
MLRGVKPLIHDPAVRSTLEARVRALRPDLAPRWGRMTVDQMLWHLNQGLSVALGALTAPPEPMPLPRRLVKFLALNLPWVKKGAPTSRAFLARETHDFDAERKRCLALIDAFATRPLAQCAADHPLFGPMNGRELSQLQAKHLDHHLRQFGV